MSLRLFFRMIAAGAVLFASVLLAAPVLAQHGGHGGGHGGHHGGGHGGHGGGHGGHGGGHGGHHGGGHHGNGGGHHGHGGHLGGYSGLHGGYGGLQGGYSGLHGGYQGGWHHYSHHDFGHHVYSHHSSGHHLPFYFGVHLGPWYGGYNDPYYNLYSRVGGQRVVRGQGKATVEAAEDRLAQNEPRAAGPTSAEGQAYKRRAKQAFLAGRYNESLRYANHALVDMPRDGELYLFTGQILFAVGDYESAAAAVHRGVSLLESKDWGRVVEDYRRYYRGQAFVHQMDRLSEYIKKNPDAAYAHFVRGYEHGFLGHDQSAIRDFSKALELEGRDELAARLLEHFGGTVPESAGQDQEGDDAQPEIPSGPKASSTPAVDELESATSDS